MWLSRISTDPTKSDVVSLESPGYLTPVKTVSARKIFFCREGFLKFKIREKNRTISTKIIFLYIREERQWFFRFLRPKKHRKKSHWEPKITPDGKWQRINGSHTTGQFSRLFKRVEGPQNAQKKGQRQLFLSAGTPY